MLLRKFAIRQSKLGVLAFGVLLAGLVLLVPLAADAQTPITNVTIAPGGALPARQAYTSDILNASTIPSLGLTSDPFGGASGILTGKNSPGYFPSGTIINITGDLSSYSVIGGIAFYSTSGDPTVASGNKVTVGNGGIVGGAATGKGSLAGGMAFFVTGGGAEVTTNTVTINTGGKVENEVFGGALSADYGEVSGNEVKISGSNISTGTVYGGQICKTTGSGCLQLVSTDTGATALVKDNHIKIDGDASTIIYEVVGGRIFRDATDASDGDAVDALVTLNDVTINGGTITKNIYGGQMKVLGKVTENTVTIINLASIGGNIAGGYGIDKVEVSSNKVYIESTNTATLHYIYGGDGEAEVAYNEVSFLGGSAAHIYGGYRDVISDSTKTIHENTVTVKNVTGITTIAGGYDKSSNGKANKNTVNVTNVSVTNIYGGYSDGTSGETNDNIVNVTNTTASIITGGTASTAARNKLYLNAVSATAIIGGAGADNEIYITGGVNSITSVANKGLLEIQAGQSSFGTISNTGPITVSGGDNTFNAAVTADSIAFTGGTSTLVGALTSTDSVEVTSATIVLKGDNLISISSASGSLNVNNSGVIKVGDVSRALTEDVNFNSGSYLDIDANGTTSNGALNVTGTVAFAQGSRINLAMVSGDPGYWTGKDIVTATSVTGGGEVISLFYDIDSSTPAQLTVGARRSFSQGIATVASGVPSGTTPNFRSLGGYVDRIDATQSNPDLFVQLTEEMYAIDQLALVDPHLAEVALRQLAGEQVLEATAGAVGTALKTLGVVYGRLDRIREIGYDGLTPPAAGDPDAFNRLWAGVYGVWSDQDARDHVEGYHFKANGVSVGYDVKVPAISGLTLGVSASYSDGDFKKDDGRTSADVDTYGVGVYGSYTLPSGLFLDASLSWGHSAFTMYTHRVMGGTATGDFDVDTLQFGARAGAVINSGSLQLIPSAGVRTTTFKQDGFGEALDAAAVASGAQAHVYGSKRDTQVDIPVQLKVNTVIETSSMAVTPEVRLGATFMAKRLDNDLTASLAGATNASYRLVGVKSPRTTYQAGLGFKFTNRSSIDFFINYDLDAGQDFTSHNGSVGLGYEF